MSDEFPHNDVSAKAEWFKMQWQAMASKPYANNREVDISLPLPLVVGCDDDMKPYLMLLSTTQPKPIKGFEAIVVKTGIRQGVDSERWSLTFTLLDWGLLRAFAELCTALLERVRHSTTAQEALKQVYLTVDQWQRLLKGARNDDQLKLLRGTIAELTAAGIISDCSGRSIEDVCDNWTGPFQAPQDYIFADKTAYEVKSLYPSTRKLVISSAEQLGDPHLTHLGLIGVTLESVPKNQSSAYNLSGVIDLLRSRSDTPSVVTESIEARLDAAGLSPYSSFSVESYFHIRSIRVYDVTQGFPRVMSDQIPAGVMNLSYELNMSDIQPFCIQVISNPLEQENE